MGFDIISSIVTGIVSPITNTITAITNKKQDVSLEKYRVDGKISLELMAHDTELQLAQKKLIQYQLQFLGFRLMQYGVMVPVVLWFAVGMYDSTFRNILPDWMTWRTLELPTDMKVTAGLVFAYLLGSTVMSKK